MNQYWYKMIIAACILFLTWMADLFLFRKRQAPEKTGWRFDLFLFLTAWLTFFVLNNHEFVAYNNYSYLSDALLHGRLDTPDLPGYLESFSLGGKIYMHFAPGVGAVSNLVKAKGKVIDTEYNTILDSLSLSKEISLSNI